MTMEHLLITNLTKKFDGLVAIDDLNVSVSKGEIRGIIGPNGAGKTTLFSLISGSLHPTAGSIQFEGKDIHGLKPHALVEKGLVRTFQRSAVFHGFTVLENVLIALHKNASRSVFHNIFQVGPRFRSSEVEEATSLIEFVGLEEYSSLQAESLALGHQRSLGIAIALATKPTLLMLDEPAAGMNATEAEELVQLVRKVRDDHGTTVMIVEHDMKLVMELCEMITAINFGAKLADGTPEEIASNADVIAAYLGDGELAEEGLAGA